MIQPNTTLPKLPKVRVYVAQISQTGTAAPTASIKLNTTGGILVWSYTAVGTYKATFVTVGDEPLVEIGFPENNTTCLIGGTGSMTEANRINDMEFQLQSLDQTGNADNGWFNDTTIEIKIYE